MAKETKAERNIRWENEAAQQELVNKEQYPKKVMHTLSRAFSYADKFLFSVQDSVFSIIQLNRPYMEYTIPYEYGGYNTDFETLIKQLDQMDEDARKIQERLELKKAALDKLTKEEKEALGLE